MEWSDANNSSSEAYWTSIASSADGRKLVALAFGTGIYTSTDYGTTWSLTLNNTALWTGVASSADGTKLAAVAEGTGIYTSANSGATWSLSLNVPASWYSIASSADGTKLAAVSSDPGTGRIYTSANSGANWSLSLNNGANFSSIASSADGTKLAAATLNGFIYTSANSGANWSLSLNNEAFLTSIASSADGTKLAAVSDGNGSGIYTSANSGATWSLSLNNTALWTGVASSADGTRLAAVASGTGIYTSTNSGVTWSLSLNNTALWTSITSSADGTKLAAVAEGSRIYTSILYLDISYPQSTYIIATNQLVGISCIVYNPNNYDLAFTINPSTLINPLDLDETTGEISGTTNFSSISAPITYTVTATNTADPLITTSTQLTLSVNFSPQFYYPNQPTLFELGKSLTIAPVPTFSNIPGIVYTLINPSSHALTDIGLNLDAVTGVITGIPITATSQITYMVEANNNGVIYDASLNISIQPIPIFSYPQENYILTQNIPISILPTLSQPGCTYSLNCILPFGLSLDSTTGEISGIPSILTTAYLYTVTITNSIGSSTTPITLSVIKEFLAPPVVGDYFSSNTFITDPEVAMRRKAEIFKYKKNSANLTKQQYFALLAKGNGPSAKRSWGTQGDAYTNPNVNRLPQDGNTIICNSGIICAPTSSSDVPGPVVNLCYNPFAVFAGYNAPNRKKVDIGFKWPQSSWRPGANGFPIGKAGSG